MASNRSFGIFFSVVFFASSVVIAFRAEGPSLSLAGVFGALAFFFAILAYRYPSSLQRLNQAWYHFGLLLGKVFSPVLLGLIFFLLITPTSMITRLFGRDELKMKRRNVVTYWIDRDPVGPAQALKARSSSHWQRGLGDDLGLWGRRPAGRRHAQGRTAHGHVPCGRGRAAHGLIAFVREYSKHDHPRHKHAICWPWLILRDWGWARKGFP